MTADRVAAMAAAVEIAVDAAAMAAAVEIAADAVAIAAAVEIVADAAATAAAVEIVVDAAATAAAVIVPDRDAAVPAATGTVADAAVATAGETAIAAARPRPGTREYAGQRVQRPRAGTAPLSRAPTRRKAATRPTAGSWVAVERAVSPEAAG